jgi:hypothetical protein
MVELRFAQQKSNNLSVPLNGRVWENKIIIIGAQLPASLLLIEDETNNWKIKIIYNWCSVANKLIVNWK